MDKKDAKTPRESEKGRLIRYIILAVLAVLIVLALYMRLTNRTPGSSQKADEQMNEVQTLKMYDLDKQYPKDARDVVKLHCRFLKALYNEELEKEDIQTLNEQVRKLFSADLLAENPEESQMEALITDINKFHADGRTYISYEVDSGNNVLYTTTNGKDYAMLYVNCKLRENGKTKDIQEQYLLVKENDLWKIQGWQEIVTDAADDTASESESK